MFLNAALKPSVAQLAATMADAFTVSRNADEIKEPLIVQKMRSQSLAGRRQTEKPWYGER